MDIIIEHIQEVTPVEVKVDANLCNCEIDIVKPMRQLGQRTIDVRCGLVMPKRKLELWDHMFGREFGDEM